MLPRQRLGVRHVTAALVAIALVALVGCSGETSSSSNSASVRPSASSASSSSTPMPTPMTLVWSRIAPAPVSGGYYPPAQAVWDGHEMLVVVSQFDQKTCSETLLSYDPATDAWSTVSDVPVPKGCYEGTDKAVWTGEELILWGISNAAYDPATDAWRKLPDPPGGAGDGGPSVVVWTGTQMLGWGGGCCDQQIAGGAAYTPATDSWRLLPKSPLAGRHAAGAWTGEEMIIAGGEGYAGFSPGGEPHVVHFADAAAYDPATRSWRRLPSMPIGRGGGYYTVTYDAVWDGSEMIVVGGTQTGSDRPLARGVAYDPSTNRWRWLPPMAFPRESFVADWIGDQLIVWGGIGEGGSIPSSGETYDPIANTWSQLPRSPLRARVDAVGVWTGEEFIVFVGTDARTLNRVPASVFLTDGAALGPA